MTNSEAKRLIDIGCETVSDAAKALKVVSAEVRESDGFGFKVYFNGGTARSKHEDYNFAAAARRASAYVKIGFVEAHRFEEVKDGR